MRRAFTVLLCVVCACWASIGLAQNEPDDPDFEAPKVESGEPRIAVLGVRTTNGRSNNVTDFLGDSLARGFMRYRVEVVEEHPAVTAARSRGAEVQYQIGLRKARKELAAGQKRYKQFDSKGAEKHLRRAADLFEEHAAGLARPDDLHETYLLLSRVFFATNREMLARDIFRRVIQLDPEMNLDVASYPPQMVKSFRAVKQEILGNPLGSLKVSSLPTGANIYLDGQPRGKTPAELINLPVGSHLLVVRNPGYAPHVQRIEVTSFRQEKVAAKLTLDRHPHIHYLLTPQGVAGARSRSPSTVAYLDAVATAARLDIIVVGAAKLKKGAGIEMRVRLYRPEGQAVTPLRTFTIDRRVEALDEVAGQLLEDAVAAGWIPALAARRNVHFGGGALDETATFRGHFAFAPGYAFFGQATNFPQVPGAGIRVGVVRRITGRLLVSAETGVDSIVEPGMVLEDGQGGNLTIPDDNVNGIFTSFPVEAGARFYVGVGTFAPYVAGGAGVSWDMLAFQENLPFDEISATSGLGWDAFVGAGTDWALSTDTGLFVEARATAGSVGVRKARFENSVTGGQALPMESDLTIGFRLLMGYLRVF